jgi:LacI family transcriptional regulator
MAQKTQQKRRPTVVEVAKRANVSRAAVYSVLNADKPTNIGIGAEKRQRVLQAAEELGYVRNEVARSIARGKTCTIGILVRTLEMDFLGEFFQKLDQLCHEAGYSVYISSSEYDTEREDSLLQNFLAKQFDGVIINRDAYGSRRYDTARIDQIADQGVGVVILGELGPVKHPLVCWDETRVSRLFVEHLMSLGHRRIGYLYGGAIPNPSMLIHQDRRRMFLETWQSAQGGPVTEYSVSDVMHGGADIARSLSALPPAQRPTAIACSNDYLALSLISGLLTRGIRVPEDISVIGCDDNNLAASAIVPLTTIRLPRDKTAQACWQLLNKQMNSHLSRHETQPDVIRIAPELIVRSSTARIETA